jgi:polyhydroxyalkanoate synthesis regulator phasin
MKSYVLKIEDKYFVHEEVADGELSSAALFDTREFAEDMARSRNLGYETDPQYIVREIEINEVETETEIRDLKSEIERLRKCLTRKGGD